MGLVGRGMENDGLAFGRVTSWCSPPKSRMSGHWRHRIDDLGVEYVQLWWLVWQLPPIASGPDPSAATALRAVNSIPPLESPGPQSLDHKRLGR